MENPLTHQILSAYMKLHWEMPTDWAAERSARILLEHWDDIKIIVEHAHNVQYQSRLEV